jgi:hypothetical protein
LNPQEAAAFGRRAQQLVLSQQGATQKTVELLEAIAASQSPKNLRKAA